MKKDVNWFVQEGLLAKTPFVRKLAPRFIEKAKNNLITLSILFDLHNDKGARESLDVPEDYDSSEWVVVCAYYAMYMAASATLATISYKSKNHTATVLALETFFVKKQLLEEDYLDMIEKAQLEKEYVDDLNLARDRREIAQYSVTKETTRRIAEEIKEDAYKFVERMEKLVADLEGHDYER
ncbi:MAG: HEPN domain-containing protein [Methanocellales archaeon]|nr:HEPN domain-containing protein [Methanocellales archaeon]